MLLLLVCLQKNVQINSIIVLIYRAELTNLNWFELTKVSDCAVVFVMCCLTWNLNVLCSKSISISISILGAGGIEMVAHLHASDASGLGSTPGRGTFELDTGYHPFGVGEIYSN